MHMPIHDREHPKADGHPLIGVSILGAVFLVGYLFMTVNAQRNCVFDAKTIVQAQYCVK